MSQTETPPQGGFLNTPPRMGPNPAMGVQQGPMMTTDQVDKIISGATEDKAPEIEEAFSSSVDLPAGYIQPNGEVVRTAVVRELNGYDEERLSRLNMNKNVALYVTEMLMLGVEMIGTEKPTKEMIQNLLIGDREALVIGIRQATYGDEVKFKLTCDKCDNESEIIVKLSEDVEITRMEDPMVRVFDVPLRHGSAKVQLMSGRAQESFSESIVKKTLAEVNTTMLAKSVIDINGIPTFGQENAVRQLSSGDRIKIIEFVAEHQPGPQFKDIPVPCATCGEEYPISLGLPNLFRF